MSSNVIVRHAETDWNIKKYVQGHTDVPLNKKGELQAGEMAKKLKEIHFDAAFSSDLIRAKKTAEIITLEKKITVKTTKVLRERYFGRLEGKSWTDESGELKTLWHRLTNLTDEERRIHNLENVSPIPKQKKWVGIRYYLIILENFLIYNLFVNLMR